MYDDFVRNVWPYKMPNSTFRDQGLGSDIVSHDFVRNATVWPYKVPNSTFSYFRCHYCSSLSNKQVYTQPVHVCTEPAQPIRLVRL